MNNTTSYVVINSKYRTRDSRSTSDFTYNIGSTLEVDGVTIKSVSIPFTQYNVNAYNSTLRVNNGGTSYDLAVTQGQYTATDLATHLVSLIQGAIGGVVTIAVNPTTKKIDFTSTTPFRFSTSKTLSSLVKYLGINYGTGFYPTTASSAFSAQNVPELQGSNNFYLASNVLSQGFASILTNGIRVPIVMPVPIDVEWGQVQQYESNDVELNTKRFARLQNLQNIDIKLYDDDLNIVDLNGSDIEVVIQIKMKSTQPEQINR